MILVIGASGFIGSYITHDFLNKGIKVLATGRNKISEAYYKKNNVPFINFDITKKDDFSQFDNYEIDAVIHLAALLPANVKNYNPYEYIDVNCTGILNLLEYCRKRNIKKIISTTSYADVQNHWKKDIPIKESTSRDFRYDGDHAMYVISKNFGTDTMLHYNVEYGFKCSIFRLPPVYGYGPHSEIYVDGKYYKSGFQIFLEKAMRGETIEIYGDPEVSRDTVYIKDLVSAFYLAIKSNNAEGVYNLTSGKAYTLNEQVKAIIEVFSPTDKISQIKYVPERKNNSMSYIFDISKARKDFGYNPEYLPLSKMLVDYKKEMDSGRFDYLVEGRKKVEN